MHQYLNNQACFVISKDLGYFWRWGQQGRIYIDFSKVMWMNLKRKLKKYIKCEQELYNFKIEASEYVFACTYVQMRCQIACWKMCK